MQLRPITMADLWLYETVLTDPAMMAELGGPVPREGLKEKLQGIVDDVERGEVWFDVIIEDGEDVGWVCVWSHDRDGEPIDEIGWMVRPKFQGRGLASTAVGSHLERARGEERWGVIRAYPAVSNGPSNAICRKNGFELHGQLEVKYLDRPLRVNDWRVET